MKPTEYEMICKSRDYALPELSGYAEREEMARSLYADDLADEVSEDERMATLESYFAWDVGRTSEDDRWVCDGCVEGLHDKYGFDCIQWPVQEEPLVPIAAAKPSTS